MKDPHSTETQYPVDISHEQPSDQQNNRPPAPVMNSASDSVSSRKVTREDIEDVQNLIERCLQLYKNREETVSHLWTQASIEPCLTNLIWQKLEEENADFFEVYYMRLKLKRQITMFNKLLEQQHDLMKSLAAPKGPLPSMQNGIPQVPGDNLSAGHRMLQQPLMPSTGYPQIDPVSGMSNCHMTNGIPAPGIFHPTAISMGNNMVMETSIADTNLAIPKSEIAPDSSYGVTSSGGQYPFEASTISDMNGDPLAIDSRFLSNNPVEGLHGGSYNEIGNSHFAPELSDFTVEQFLADFPQGLAVEDESHGNDSTKSKSYVS